MWNSVIRPTDNSYSSITRDISEAILGQLTEPLSFYTMLLSDFDTNNFTSISRPIDNSWNTVNRPS